MARQKLIPLQQRNHLSNKSLFWVFWQIFLFGRCQQIGETSDEVYGAQMRLCCEIKLCWFLTNLFIIQKVMNISPPSYSKYIVKTIKTNKIPVFKDMCNYFYRHVEFSDWSIQSLFHNSCLLDGLGRLCCWYLSQLYLAIANLYISIQEVPIGWFAPNHNTH